MSTSIKKTVEWLKKVESEIGGIGVEYSTSKLPAGVYDLKLHRAAVRYGLVRKKMGKNAYGGTVCLRTSDGNYIWEIAIAGYRNI